jgi:hypothetical protein
MESIDEKGRKRLQFMHRLYEVTGGSQWEFINTHELGAEFGWSTDETDRVVEYLEGEGLVEYRTMGPTISITHLGVLEVEGALSNPRQETAHFPAAVNIIHIGQMHGSQIQQGTTHSQQHGQFISEVDRGSVQELVEKLRAVLPEAGLAQVDRHQAEAELATVEAQLNSPRPKRSFVRSSLETVRDLLEPIASISSRSAELAEALEQLHKLLPGI